ncbi:MAG: ROK family protein [Planctomycetota bacterium]
MTTLGIDIGGTSVKVARLSPGMEPATARSAAYTNPSADDIRGAIASAVSGVMRVDGSRAVASDVTGVGLCAPGRLDEDHRVVAAVNLPGLVGQRLTDLLPAEAAGAPNRVCADAEAAAVDVWIRWGLSGRLLAISLGTGVGACVLDDGVPLRVSGDSPGHFGQIDVGLLAFDAATPIGPDGGRGSLEAYIGWPALRRRFGDHGATLRLEPSDPALMALARAIRIGHAVYRPHHVALLGGVGLAIAEPSIEALSGLVSDQLTSLARSGWTLRRGETTFHAALGAAWLASQK